MKYRIHFTLADGSEDHVVIEGESDPELRERAGKEVAKRGGTNAWSEPVTP